MYFAQKGCVKHAADTTWKISMFVFFFQRWRSLNMSSSKYAFHWRWHVIRRGVRFVQTLLRNQNIRTTEMRLHWMLLHLTKLACRETCPHSGLIVFVLFACTTARFVSLRCRRKKLGFCSKIKANLSWSLSWFLKNFFSKLKPHSYLVRKSRARRRRRHVFCIRKSSVTSCNRGWSET